MSELNFKRAEGFVGGGNATKFIDENFKVCPMCHTHEPHWSACGELHSVGGASVFEKSFGYIKCDKCQAIYKHKMIDLLKFTDRNVLRTPFGKKIDVGSLDVNDIEFEIYNTGIDPTAAQYLGTKFTVRMMNADILRAQEGHTPNPSGQEAYAESKGSSMFSYIGDKVNGETVSDIAAKKEMIKNGICPGCNGQIDPNAETCPTCGYVLNAPQTERAVCTTCGSTLDVNGVCPRCSGQPQYGAPQYGQPQYGAPQYGQPQYSAPQYGAPTSSNDRPAAFNIFSLLSLIFSFFALIFSDMAAIVGEYDEESMIGFLVFSLMFNIPAFIFQFIARKKKSFVLWKIFSWVAFGFCILTFLIIFLSLAML